jgi:hypothetical protein
MPMTETAAPSVTLAPKVGALRDLVERGAGEIRKRMSDIQRLGHIGAIKQLKAHERCARV